jgi:hypothetical protein
MTSLAPVVRHLGPRSAALAERLATSLAAAEVCGHASRELVAALTAGRPIVAIAAVGIPVRPEAETILASTCRRGESGR